MKKREKERTSFEGSLLLLAPGLSFLRILSLLSARRGGGSSRGSGGGSDDGLGNLGLSLGGGSGHWGRCGSLLGLRGLSLSLGSSLLLGLGRGSDLRVSLKSLGGGVVDDGVVVLLDDLGGFGLDSFGGYNFERRKPF